MHSISILISTKNRFHDLKECIESALAQSIKPDEVILVDASDTNKSREMVERLLRREEREKSGHILKLK